MIFKGPSNPNHSILQLLALHRQRQEFPRSNTRSREGRSSPGFMERQQQPQATRPKTPKTHSQPNMEIFGSCWDLLRFKRTMSSRFCGGEIGALHLQDSRFRLSYLKPFPTLSPRRIQPQTPPRLSCLPNWQRSAPKTKKKKRQEMEWKKKIKINPRRFSSSSCRLLESLFGRTRISAPAVPGSRIRQVKGDRVSGFTFLTPRLCT